ncbi:GlxA family transcriptional regulator, partial [Methylobacterium sp. WL18]
MPKTPRFSPDTPRPVELLAFPAVQLLDVAGPLQVFATANDLSGGLAPYAPRVIAAGDGALT